MRSITILGSTGSIGTQALDVVRRHPERFKIVGLSAAGMNQELLVGQTREFLPPFIAIADENAAADVKAKLGQVKGVELIVGPDAAEVIAAKTDADFVLNGLVGSAGLAPTLAALQAGKTVALANKESLVVGGELDRASVKEALQHPVWSMGPKITIDSATLMNKGLEVIEAHHLFDLEYSQIHVLIHPEGQVHALAEFRDGSLRAEMATADMRLPIQLALAWPERLSDGVGPVPLTDRPLTFEPVDREAFPAVDLAYRVGGLGLTFPAVMNAANEVAVMAFLEGKIPLTRIVEIVQSVVDEHDPASVVSIVNIERADHWGRRRAVEIIEER
jgi:1-deoxy-D-xylulose-5-phosphate reductoisomerase